jgi:hypothetical protein
MSRKAEATRAAESGRVVRLSAQVYGCGSTPEPRIGWDEEDGMRRAVQLLMGVMLVGGTTACDDAMAPDSGNNMEIVYDFHAGVHGWIADFTDYQDGQDDIYEFESGQRALPLPLDTTRRAFMLSSMNRSDDMFQYIRQRIGGLEAGTEYEIRYRVQIATNAGKGCVGVGGAPGESVWLKTGASQAEPKPVLEHGDWRLSVDKGEQAAEGEAAIILGDMASSSTDCTNAPYELKNFDSQQRRVVARTDDHGRLWLFAGTESGFESRTRIYITRIQVNLYRKS